MWINRRAELVDETTFNIEFGNSPPLKVHILCDQSAIIKAIVAPDNKLLWYELAMMGNTTISTEMTA